jgi:hypothetical protein
LKKIRYTLLGDGSSDKALMPLLDWLLQKHYEDYSIQSAWADLHLKKGERRLHERIKTSLELYPCDLLFVHRDAENQPMDYRIEEIKAALMHISDLQKPVVHVIPIRMQEAWLLIDEQAIRWSAGNENGKMPLKLPSLKSIENLPDPKEVLNDLLREASGLNRRRRSHIPVSRYAQRVAEYIEDFAPLRQLTGFQYLQAQIEDLVQSNWPGIRE